ncbi:MAG: choice-of-anchor Q domain-containing protein [Planctomycetaceae bacterium]
MESLEDRLLLTVRVALGDAPGLPGKSIVDLEVFTDPGASGPRDENIDISLNSSGHVVITDLVLRGSPTLPWIADTELTPDQIHEIRFTGGPLNDRINNGTTVAGIFNGGDGNDILIGGSSADVLTGGNGDDTLLGNAGNDYLFGENGADTLIGGDGYDVLFGGAEGFNGDASDVLHGGAGGAFNQYEADRILIHQNSDVDQQTTLSDIVDDRTPEDAVIVFTDPVASADAFDVTWSPGKWLDSEIIRMDNMLQNLFMLSGNNRLLQSNVSPDGSLSFIRYGDPSSETAVAAWNSGSGRMGIPSRGLSDADSVWFEQVVYHELGHNWDDQSENPFADAFRDLSGWTQVPGTLVSTYEKWVSPWYTDQPHIQAKDFSSDEDRQWYFDNTAQFVRPYGATFPWEDFATTFAYYVLRDDYISSEDDWFTDLFGLGTVSAQPEKVNNIDQLFRLLEDTEHWKTTVDSFHVPTADDTPTLRWDSLEGSAGYNVWVRNDTTGQTQLVTGRLQTSSYTFPTALADGFYTFWVLAHDDAGRPGNWSEPGTFRVAAAAEVPVPAGPTGTVNAQGITFTWNDVVNADSYQLWVERSVDTDGDGQNEWVRILNNTGAHDEIRATAWTAPTDAPAGDYRFRVRSLNGAQVPSAWSSFLDFQVDGPTPIVVDSLLDTEAQDGHVTLREALEAMRQDTTYFDAVADSRTREIRFAPGLTGTIELVNGILPGIGDDATIITGPGPEVITIDGGENGGIFAISNVPQTVTITGLTLTRGKNGVLGSGGAIFSDSPGLLTLDNLIITNNSASSIGGGIYLNGAGTPELIIRNSTVSNNSAGSVGGGVGTLFGSVQIINSTFDDNAGSFGGAVYASEVQTLGSTFSNNEALGSGGAAFVVDLGVFELSTFSANHGGTVNGSRGGAIYSEDGILEITASTITQSSSADGGAVAVRDAGGSLYLMDSIVAGNTAGSLAADVYHHSSATVDVVQTLIGDNTGLSAVIPDDQGNLIGDPNSGGVIDALLAPLSDNGGQTWTHALQTRSPAVDQIATSMSRTTADQRGVARPIGDAVDMGSFEKAEDIRVSVTASAATLVEDGIQNSLVTFQRSGDLSQPLTVSFTLEGDAASGVDYVLAGAASLNGAAGTVQFPAGVAQVSVTIDPTRDDVLEFREDAIVRISAGTGYLPETASASATVGISDRLRFLVTTAVDEEDFGNDQVSLREAILASNLAPGVQEIRFSPALTDEQSAVVRLNSVLPAITDSVTVTGPGADQLAIDAHGRSAILVVDDGDDNRRIDVSISGLTLRNGTAENGGAILSSENLTIDSLEIRDSRAVGHRPDFHGAELQGAIGGGVWSDGDLTVRNSTIAGNQAGTGGGIFASGPLTVINSTVAANTVDTFVQTTSGQTASGIHSNGDLTLLNSTIAGNTAILDIARHAGGLAVGSGNLSIVNTIIAGNTGVYYPNEPWRPETLVADLVGVISGGVQHSLLGQVPTGSGLTTGSDGNVVGVDWKSVLANDGVTVLLSDNGGPTRTIMILSGSEAVDAGDNAAVAGVLDFDQRLTFPRVNDGNDDQTAAVDLGAVELRRPAGRVLISSSTVSAQEGGTDGHYQISLDRTPTGPVEVTVYGDSQFGVSIDGVTFSESIVLQFSTTESQRVYIRAVDDAISEGRHTARVRHQITGSVGDDRFPNDLNIPTVALALIDNEPAGISVSEAVLVVDENAGTATFDVFLESEPAPGQQVVLNVDSSATGGLSVSPATLTFLPGNWQSPQTVTVTGIDDARATGDQVLAVRLSVDADLSDDAYDLVPSEYVDIIRVDHGATLRVLSAEATPSGFLFEFSEAVNADLINLSTGGATPDFVVTGAAGGTLAGSLLFGANPRFARFVASQGVVPADTYTITLRSAADGWTSFGGKLLDGNADGADGGDYQTSITVAAANDVITVSLPKLVRGSGQYGNLPLTISSGRNVAEISFILEYDPALLQIFDIRTFVGGSFGIDHSTPGRMVFSAQLTAPNPNEGPLEGIGFDYRVPDDAPSASKHVLNISNLKLIDVNGNELPSIDDDGIHITSYFGDLNGSNSYNAPDAILLQRLIAQINSGLTGYQQVDPVLVADITRNGSLQANDTISIQRAIAQIEVDAIPDLPEGITPAVPDGPDPKIYVAQDLTAAPGDTISVPVQLEVTEAAGITVGGIDLALSYDPAVLSVASAASVQKGGLLDGTFTLVANTSTPGTIILTSSSATGTGNLPLGTIGSLFTIDFVVNAGASGSTAINVLPSFGTTTTAVFDNNLDSLVLSPAPTAAADDSVDGTLTISSVVDPPPTLSITPNTGSTSTNPIVFTFQFSEVVTGFEAADISVVNGSGQNFSVVDGDTYTVEVVPTAAGAVTVSVAADAVTDAGSNGNVASSASVNFVVDPPPTLSITPNTGSTSTNPIVFTFQFSEVVTGFEAADISVVNGSGPELFCSGW